MKEKFFEVCIEPLTYMYICKLQDKKIKKKNKKFLRAGLEPATYGFQYTTTVHRSTSWAIEGTTIEPSNKR